MAIALTSGMRNNLLALQSVDKMMTTTQNRLSTGKRVNSALDDPVNFFKAQDHHNRASDLAALKDGMNESIKVIEAANTGIENIQALLNQMKSLASAAKTTEDATGLVAQYNEIIQQIGTLATDSSYGGQNLLNGDSNDVVFDEAGDHTLRVDGTDVTATTPGLIGVATLTNATALDDGEITTAFTEIDAAISLLRTEAQKLSSSLSTIQIRADFTNEMVNTLNTGGDNLVLADMNEEGANMLMLQTRQSLGTTSLSLASQAAQAVLRLF